MYIVYDRHNDLEQIKEKYLTLELDTVDVKGEKIVAYAVIDNSLIPLDEISKLQESIDLHANLIKNYNKRNWNYCEQAIEHLVGKFKGEIDSFYKDLLIRIEQLKEIDLPNDWSGEIKVE